MAADVVIHFDSDEDAITVANLISKMMAERGISTRLNGVEELPRKRLNDRIREVASKGQFLISVDAYTPVEPQKIDFWSEYLTVDPEDGMIVKGTLVKVKDIVSLIVEGSTWTDILRTHPELTEEDIRACIGYAIHQELPDNVDCEEDSGGPEAHRAKTLGRDDRDMGHVCRFPACEAECQGTGCHVGEADADDYEPLVANRVAH